MVSGNKKRGIGKKLRILVISFLLFFLLSALSLAQSWPDPGHPAGNIGGGTFNGSYGNFLFPANVNVSINNSLYLRNGPTGIAGLYPVLSIGDGTMMLASGILASKYGLYVLANASAGGFALRAEAVNATDDAQAGLGETDDAGVHRLMGVYAKYSNIKAFLANKSVAVYGDPGAAANAYAGYFKGDTTVASGNLYSNNIYGTLPTASAAGSGFILYTQPSGTTAGDVLIESGSLSGSSSNLNGSKLWLTGANTTGGGNIILSTGATPGNHTIQFSDINNATSVTVYPQGNLSNVLVINKTATGEKQSLLSVDQMALSQLNGGAYFGRVGIKENQWGLNKYGETWTAKGPSGKWYAIAMSSDGKIQTAANYSTSSDTNLYVSNDYGNTWTAKGPIAGWWGIAMSSDGKIQTATNSNVSSQLYVSTDYGNTWTAKGSSAYWSGIGMSSDGKIQTAGRYAGGQLYISYDYGNTWTAKLNSGTWIGVAISSDGKIQTVSNQSGQLYVSTDYGNTWTAKGPAESGNNWYGVAMSSDGKIQTAANYSSSGFSYLYGSTDYGNTWTVKSPIGTYRHAAMSSDGKIQIVGYYGGNLYISTDYGITWTAKSLSGGLYGIAMSSDGKIQTLGINSGNLYVSYADSFTFGNVGINTNNATSTLTVNGTINVTTDICTGSGKCLSTASGGGPWNSSTGKVYLNTTTDYVGIGTTAPSSELQVNGSKGVSVSLINITYSGTGYTLNCRYPYGIYVSGRFAYATDFVNNNVCIWDVSNPISPALLSYYNNNIFLNSSYGVVGSGKYLYIAYRYGLSIIDVSNPKNITFVSNYTDSSLVYAASIFLSGKYVYLRDISTNLEIIDVSNVLSPVRMGKLSSFTSSYTTVKSLYVAGRYAYVANGADLSIVDISNASNPFIVASYHNTTTLSQMQAVTVSGRYAYVIDGPDSSIGIIDISNASKPVLAGSYANAGLITGDLEGIALAGNYLIVNAPNISVFDVSNVSNIVLKTYFNHFSAGDVTISGKYAYIGDFSYGYNIYEIPGLDSPTASIGDIQTSHLSVADNANVHNNLYVDGGMNVGPGGFYTDGNSAIGGSLSVDGGPGIVQGNSIPLSVGYGDSLLTMVVNSSYYGVYEILSDTATQAFGMQGMVFNSSGQQKVSGSIARISNEGFGWVGVYANYTDTGATYPVKAFLANKTVAVYGFVGNNSNSFAGYFDGNTLIQKNSSLNSSGDKESLLSVDQMQLGQLNGGAYFGRVGIKENQWGVSDYGNTWTAKGSTTAWLFGVAMSSDGKIQTTANWGSQLYVSTDYGNTWSAKGGTGNWPGIAMSSDGKIQTATNWSGYLYVSTDYGNTWANKGSTGNWNSIAVSSDGKIQTAGDWGGNISVSYDYGSTWTKKGPAAAGNWQAIAMSSDGKVQTAASFYGNLYISTDYGNTWTSTSSSTTWHGIAMSSDGKIQTAGTYLGQLYVSNDYGNSWAAKGSTGNWSAVAMSSDGKVQLTANFTGNIFVSTDYGNTWTAKGSTGNWAGVAMSSDGKVMTATDSTASGYIYVSYSSSYINGNVGIGANSSSYPLTIYKNMSEKESLLSVDQMALSQLNGGAYFGRTGIKENQWGLNNYGNTWTPVTNIGTGSWYTVAMSSDGKIQTTGNYSGNLYVSTDYGQTWIAKSSIADWYAVAMSSDGKIQIAANYSGQLMVSYDYGNTWTAKGPSGTGNAWICGAMSSDGKIMAAANTSATDVGKIYISTDYGNTWTAKSPPGNWKAVAMSSDGKIQTATNYSSSNLYVSTDYGNTWTAKTSAGTGNWWSVAMSSDGKIQTAANYSGKLYVSTDYGNTWTAKGSTANWRGVAMSSDGKIQTAASISSGYLYISTDYGQTWTTKGSTGSWQGIAMSSDGKIQTALNLSGRLYISYADTYINSNVGIGTSNPGQVLTIYKNMSSQEKEALLSTDQMQLSQLNGGAYFGRVGIKENQWGLTNYGQNWSAKMALGTGWRGVAMSSDGSIQLAANNSATVGYLYVSTNYGTTWTSKTSAGTGTWFGVAMSSDGKIMIAANNSATGYLYGSTDYGSTWTRITNAGSRNWYAVAMSSDGKFQTATVISSGYLYVSSDYGNTWTQKGTTGDWRAVAMSSDGKIQIAANNSVTTGYLTVSYDYGQTWTPKGKNGGWYGVTMNSDGKYMTAINYSGITSNYIFVSNDSGNTWTAKNGVGAGPWLYSAAMSSDGKIQVVGNSSNYLYVSTDYGSTWSAKTSTGTGTWYGIAMSSDGKVITASRGNALYVSYADSFTNGNVNVLGTLNATRECGNRLLTPVTNQLSGDLMAANMNSTLAGVDVRYSCVNCVLVNTSVWACSTTLGAGMLETCIFKASC